MVSLCTVYDGPASPEPGAPIPAASTTTCAFFPRLASLDLADVKSGAPPVVDNLLAWLRVQRACGLASLQLDDCVLPDREAQAVHQDFPEAYIKRPYSRVPR
ncbi:hypothetical protein BV25DRAFT_378144 [Artomyces pyxidatus]|uniref:Uncharacterized protein n=1 Tax=Artomyces pyxidatus TaxID=48021 RepID=A0ACB8T4Q8_9AGAM|nr:hypothetical protein BV25DRAFT_378144 [Artomyces pyxidatus]